MRNMKYCLLLMLAGLALPAWGQFSAQDKDGRIEVHDGGKLVFGWQHGPLSEPKGGKVFASSAFIHPLVTPSGFAMTDIQPDDHLHHYGVWWPWKKVTVNGKDHITWELQDKQGRHRAVQANIVRAEPGEVILNARNVAEITEDGEHYRPVIEEQVAMVFKKVDGGYQLDLGICQDAAKGEQVTIPKYRYSGFSWRGTDAWTAENSVMLASGGHHRDNANHQPANWVMVKGDTPGGKATMLIMSAAPMAGGEPERLRVWGSKQHHGMPFVNFNPVVKESVQLKREAAAVSRRSYRLIMVDRAIEAEEADALWKAWAEAAGEKQP